MKGIVYNDYDFDKFQNKLSRVCKEQDLNPLVLGTVHGNNILLLRKKRIDGPRILIAGGFHGEEPSGPWSILKFLDEYRYPSDVNMAFLPMVNPTGFRLSRRANWHGHKPNRGYINVGDGESMSEEDKILRDNGNVLKQYAKDSLLAMHEDDEEKFFMYSLGKNDKLVDKLKEIGNNYFGLKEDNAEKGKESYTKGGVVKGDYDGTFEHFINRKGCDICLTIELPGRRDFKERVNCGAEIIFEASKGKYY
jgi:predicted deacylase